MSDDFGEISYLDESEGSGYVDMSRLHNFASNDFDDEPDDGDGETKSSDDASGTGKIVLTMLGILLVLVAIGGAIWYFVFSGNDVETGLPADDETSAIEQTDDVEDSDVTIGASDIPESKRDKTSLAEAKTTTVAAFVAELQERGFETEGLDVDVPYTSDGEVYTGTEGISGVASFDSSGQSADTGAGDGSTAGANAVTDGSVAEDGAVDSKSSTDADKGETSTDETETEAVTESDKGDSSKMRGERFPILRARLTRTDGAKFEVEWMDGDIKMRLVSDADGRLTKAVYVVETDEVAGFDRLHLTIWREKLSETSEFACRTRKITADAMERVDFAAARDAIAGTGDVSDILVRRPQDGAATDGKDSDEVVDDGATGTDSDTETTSEDTTDKDA